VDCIYTSDDNTLKLTEDEENDWHSLHPLGVQFEGYKTFRRVCGVHTVKQVLHQHLGRPEENVAADELIFLYVLKGLVVARKYMCQFDIEDSIVIICNRAKNELYNFRAGGQRERTDNTSLLFQSISSTDHLTFSLNYYNTTQVYYLCD
jgi:hypothetical protein